MTITRMTLLTLILLLGIIRNTSAQDKFDFAIAYIDINKIVVIENNQSVQKIDIPKRNGESYEQTTLLLNQVSKMTESGWEVISINGYACFYLKRKRN